MSKSDDPHSVTRAKHTVIWAAATQARVLRARIAAGQTMTELGEANGKLLSAVDSLLQFEPEWNSR